MSKQCVLSLLLTVAISLTLFAKGATGADLSVFSGSDTWYTFHIATTGSDFNDGLTSNTAFRTFEKTLRTAHQYRADNTVSVRVLVHPGTYRPSTFGDADNRVIVDEGWGGSDTAFLVEAQTAHSVIVKGSEIFTNWQVYSGSIYTNDSGYYFGTNEVPSWPNAPSWTNEVGLRRELVFVDGKLLTPVEALAGLSGPGMFYAEQFDSTNTRYYIWPPAGSTVTATGTNVEVSVAPMSQYPLFYFYGVGYNIGVKGMIFEHAATELGKGALSFIYITNSYVDTCVFRYNTWIGLLAAGSNQTVVNCSFISNGWRGITPPKMDSYVSNCEFIGNNWRGIIAGYTGTDAAGYKALGAYGMSVLDSVFASNYTHGIWFDSICSNILLRGNTIIDNYESAIYVEKSHGPIYIEENYISGNRVGIYHAASWNVYITSNTIISNDDAALDIDVRENVPYTAASFPWLGGDLTFSSPSNTYVYSNRIVVGGGEEVYRMKKTGAEYRTNYQKIFAQTLYADYNSYYASSGYHVFDRVLSNNNNYVQYTTSFWDWRGYNEVDYHSRWEQTPSFDVEDGLVAHFAFDEGAGGTTTDAINGNVGTVNGATWTSDAHDGSALSFDGLNDVVTVPDDASLSPTNEITVTVWAKGTAANWANVDTAFVYKYLEYGIGPWTATKPNSSYLKTMIRTAASPGSQQIVYNYAPVPVSNWHFYTLSYDGSTLRNYIDGVLQNTYSVSGAPNTAGTVELRIGRWSGYFEGVIDDVRIYKRALSDYEVQALYADHKVVLVGPADGITTNDVTPTFSWQGAPANRSPYQYELCYVLDTTTNTMYIDASETNYTPPSDMSNGTYEWRVRMITSNYMYASWSDARTLSVATAPVVTLSPSAITTNASFTLTMNVDKSNAFWSTNGIAGPYNQFVYPATTNITIERDTVVYYYGKGYYTSPTNSNTYVIDTNAPSAVTLVAPTNFSQTGQTQPTFTWDAATDASGIYGYIISIDGETSFAGTNTTFTPATNLAEGYHTWSVRAIDVVNNTNAIGETRVLRNEYNDGGPEYTLVSPDESAYVASASPDTTYNASSNLFVSNAGGNTVATYITFTLPTNDIIFVDTATLRLTLAEGQGTHALYAVSNTTWERASITWNTRPLPASLVASADAAEGAVLFDLSAFIKSNMEQGVATVSFCLLASNTGDSGMYMGVSNANTAVHPTLSLAGYSGDSVPPITVSPVSLVTNRPFTVTLSALFAYGYWSTNGGSGPYERFTAYSNASVLITETTRLYYFGSNTGGVGPVDFQVYTMIDDIAPAAPTLSAMALPQGGIHLSWDAYASNDFSHYVLYRGEQGTVSTNSVYRLTNVVTNAFTDTNTRFEHTYYYTLVVVDTSTNYSPAADVIAVTTPQAVANVGLSNEALVFNASTRNALYFGTRTTDGATKSVTLTIFTLSGSVIANVTTTTTEDRIAYDLTTYRSAPLPQGSYIYHIIVDDGTLRKEAQGVFVIFR